MVSAISARVFRNKTNKNKQKVRSWTIMKPSNFKRNKSLRESYLQNYILIHLKLHTHSCLATFFKEDSLFISAGLKAQVVWEESGKMHRWGVFWAQRTESTPLWAGPTEDPIRRRNEQTAENQRDQTQLSKLYSTVLAEKCWQLSQVILIQNVFIFP